MAKLDLLQDGFVGATIDTAIWTANYVGGAMTLTQNNVGIVTLTAAANYSAFYNSTAQDLTDSYAFIETTTVPNQSTNAQAFLKLEEDSNNYFFILLENGTLYFQEVVAGTPTTLSSVSWNATTYKWWRIRELSGTVYYDTSEDGIVWTNRTSVVATVDATVVKPSIGAGTYQTETSPGTFQFDKFNMQPLNLVTDTFNDNSLDTDFWGTTVANGGAIANTNQRLELTINASASSPYSLISSDRYYNLKDNSLKFQVTETDTASRYRYIQFYLRYKTYANYLRILVQLHPTPASSTISVRKYENSVSTYSSSEVDQPNSFSGWLRIREATGTVYFEKSDDNVTWDTLGSTSSPNFIDHVKPIIYYEQDSASGTAYAYIDNINVQTLTQTGITSTAAIGTSDLNTDAQLTPTSINSTVVNEVFLVIPRRLAINYSGETKPTTNYTVVIKNPEN
jgi:hypothetical protein